MSTYKHLEREALNVIDNREVILLALKELEGGDEDTPKIEFDSVDEILDYIDTYLKQVIGSDSSVDESKIIDDLVQSIGDVGDVLYESSMFHTLSNLIREHQKRVPLKIKLKRQKPNWVSHYDPYHNVSNYTPTIESYFGLIRASEGRIDAGTGVVLHSRYRLLSELYTIDGMIELNMSYMKQELNKIFYQPYDSFVMENICGT